MSGDDELDRLLREVDASLAGSSGGASTPAKRQDAAPATRSSADAAQGGSRTGRALRTGLVAGVVSGAVVGTGTFLLAWLPLIDNPISSAMGAFVGAFGTGAVLSFTRR
jgi:F0F1-type ATP synthase assembly protein I